MAVALQIDTNGKPGSYVTREQPQHSQQKSTFPAGPSSKEVPLPVPASAGALHYWGDSLQRLQVYK
jgi:hypothetical protein